MLKIVRKKVVIFVMAVLIVLSQFAVAEASGGFLLGFIVGNSLSHGSSSNGGTDSGVIYVAPFLGERIGGNALQIRQTALTVWNYPNNSAEAPTLQELFNNRVKNSNTYEILQVVRVFHGSDPSTVSFWFSYIEKSLVKPISSMAPPSKKK